MRWRRDRIRGRGQDGAVPDAVAGRIFPVVPQARQRDNFAFIHSETIGLFLLSDPLPPRKNRFLKSNREEPGRLLRERRRALR